MVLGLVFILAPASMHACAACFGKSDSKLAEGLNMGIFALLGFVLLVMVWIAGFFAYLARRAAAQDAAVEGTDNVASTSNQPLP